MLKGNPPIHVVMATLIIARLKSRENLDVVPPCVNSHVKLYQQNIRNLIFVRGSQSICSIINTVKPLNVDT